MSLVKDSDNVGEPTAKDLATTWGNQVNSIIPGLLRKLLIEKTQSANVLVMKNGECNPPSKNVIFQPR